MRHLLFTVTALLCSSLALGNAHTQSFPTEEGTDEQLSNEIQTFLNEYADVYNRQDYATLFTMWDQDNPNPIYMAEEIDPPLHGWNRLQAYFNPKPGFTVLDGIRNEYSEVRAHYLSEDLAVATYKLRYDIKVKRQKPMSSWDRVMAVFRKRDGEWKLTAYAEAPQSPLTMVRKMLQEKIPEDFDDYLDMRKQEAKK
jgi:ketosteroid isomerase-like protein